ncbi:MAG: UDP-N-acetylmuramate dehydrogenase [Nannocystaceae bacterium]
MPAPGLGHLVMAQLGELTHANDLTLRQDEALARHTTLRLGGPADVWVQPRTWAATAELLARCHDRAVPVTHIGSGTNLLVRDGGIRGVVVNLRHLNRVWCPARLTPAPATPGLPWDLPWDMGTDLQQTSTGVLVFVEAGSSTGRLLNAATAWHLGGLEFLGGVPGTVGGGLVMNAGTYLGEFTDVTVELLSLRPDGTGITRRHAECGFAYRSSALPKEEIVAAAVLELAPRSPDEIAADISVLRARRRAREPRGVANSGSTFKNPPNDHAGRLIETAGLKGLSLGAATVSPVHANWLVIDPKASAPPRSVDLIGLINKVRDRVRQRHGVALTLEVNIIGDDL